MKILPYISSIKKFGAGCQWFTPVILATQETEISPGK
jgi:hypothetical protein